MRMFPLNGSRAVERLSSRGRTQPRYTHAVDEKLAYSARVERFVTLRLARRAFKRNNVFDVLVTRIIIGYAQRLS